MVYIILKQFKLIEGYYLLYNLLQKWRVRRK